MLAGIYYILTATPSSGPQYNAFVVWAGSNAYRLSERERG